MAAANSPRRDRTRFVLAAIGALVGFVWILQGLGVPIGRGSFMIGDPTWTIIGLVLLAAAAGYAFWPTLRRH